ncbi:hypothetical protein [Psychromicrobium lacuslunae]|uniref:Uncharacterized protein n=1 Tax=Psychromicrobium lacuslunae TaxID=1618207 RepID=A0A0D4C226_9MICC|nr:hypothetical protein [Psychromicrobium lacuslunae]AJT42426.1 hypothetical protein UM93_14640 [Psychromicrobium lacuslunae]
MGTQYPPDFAGTLARLAQAVEVLQAKASRADRLAAEAIDGMVVTGATIRTNDGPDRVELTGDNLSVFTGNVLQVLVGPSIGLSLRDPNSGEMVPLSDQAFGSATGAYPGTLTKTIASGGSASDWQLIVSTPVFTSRTGRINLQATAAVFKANGYKSTIFAEMYLTGPDADVQIAGTVQAVSHTDQNGFIGGSQVPLPMMKNVIVPPGIYRLRVRWKFAPGAAAGPNGGSTDHVGTISDINTFATPQ